MLGYDRQGTEGRARGDRGGRSSDHPPGRARHLRVRRAPSVLGHAGRRRLARDHQVRRIVRACYDAGLPWVARGSRTGLSGGALPLAEGVLIHEVDLDNNRVVVEPGVTSRSPRRLRQLTSIRPIPRVRSRAPSVATSPRTQAGLHLRRARLCGRQCGFQHVAPVADFLEDTWDALLAILITSPFLLAKYGV